MEPEQVTVLLLIPVPHVFVQISQEPIFHSGQVLVLHSSVVLGFVVVQSSTDEPEQDTLLVIVPPPQLLVHGPQDSICQTLKEQSPKLQSFVSSGFVFLSQSHSVPDEQVTVLDSVPGPQELEHGFQGSSIQVGQILTLQICVDSGLVDGH